MSKHLPQAAQAVAAPFKMDKFKNVESKVFQNVDMSMPEMPVDRVPAKPVRLATTLASKSGAQAHAAAVAAAPAAPKTRALPAVPKRSDVNVLAPRRDVNFKSANARAVIEARVDRPESASSTPNSFQKNDKYGKVRAPT